jgi:glutamate---cysteine ligase / carboxylate-amine ligase
VAGMPTFTIGVEEEYQIVDPETRELRSYITRLLETGSLILREQVHAELHQSIVEISTEICNTPADARAASSMSVRRSRTSSARDGLKIAAAGTHPFSSWVDQEITPFDRYLNIREDMQVLAQQILIFGTHVHIGIADPEFVVDVMNVARYMLPHILCLSTSSPFWLGQDTGLKSYRSVVFRSFPRTGIPPQFRSAADFRRLVDTLVSTNCIPDGSKIYWDVRPHFKFPTLEFRGCTRRTRETRGSGT